MRSSIIVLGSTGSIGRQTLEVIAHLNTLYERGESSRGFDIVGLAAGNNRDLLLEQARRFQVKHIALACAEDCRQDNITFLGGTQSAQRLVESVACDIVLAAMVGVAGLPATLSAVALGRAVALANKETLVAAGNIVVPAAKQSGSVLLPVDSEHAGIWECLWSRKRKAPPLTFESDINKVTLTASGGPFRGWTAQQLENATPAQAATHPTWKMGGKVTLDSASLMNKGLELIEAHWLFSVPADRLDAVVHPQSIVHALVEFRDGSTLAQLAHPDMRLPIHTALMFPDSVQGMTRGLDLGLCSQLTFEPVDATRFPAVNLAKRVVSQTTSTPAIGAWFNAANEVLGECFLRGQITFMDISRGVEYTVETMYGSADSRAAIVTLSDVFESDQRARDIARKWALNRSSTT